MTKQSRKETPIKYCESCGKKLERKRWSNGKLEALIHFNRRKYCDQKCMSKSFTGRELTEDPSWFTAHKRARELAEVDKCDVCGATNNLDVHHKDGNWKNNSVGNLQVLCRSCHTRTHRKRVCIICGDKHKGLGYCEKHYQRYKKYGNPFFKKQERGY